MLAYSLKTLQMAWLGDQVALWREDAHHCFGLWALHQHHRHPQPTSWGHCCPDWPCSSNRIFCDEEVQQCYILWKILPPPHTHTKKKRIKTTSATEMPFRDCLLSLPPCCSLSLLAATRLSVVSGGSDLDILEFKNHFCCPGHLLCLILQLPGHLQPDRRVHGEIRREHCPCSNTQQCRWRSTSTRSTTRRTRSAAPPPSMSSSTVGLDLMATRTTPGLGFYHSPII